MLAAATLLAACAPVTISATLFADKARLMEVEVDRDKAPAGKIVLIDIRGLIADRSPSPLLGPGYNPVDELTARLRKARDDRDIRAVILRINSPGGTVTASDMVYREVRRFADESGKPVVASLGEVAASGGYYLALAGDRIVAEPSSITGSIGVIIPTLNISEGLERIGIRSRALVSGENKDVANPLERPREGHYALLQAMVDEFHLAFRQLVVARRADALARASGAAPGGAIPESRLNQLTDGRIFTGRQAMDAGLVDAVGGVHESFGVAKELAGLKGARLVKYYRQDADIPRSAYAPTAAAAAPGSTEINFIQIRAESLGAQGGLESAGAYYLWLASGAGP